MADHPQAHALVLVTLAHAKLLFSDTLGSRADLEEAGKLLEGVDGVDRSVSAAFYEVKADYHKVSEAPFNSSRAVLSCVCLAERRICTLLSPFFALPGLRRH